MNYNYVGVPTHPEQNACMRPTGNAFQSKLLLYVVLSTIWYRCGSLCHLVFEVNAVSFCVNRNAGSPIVLRLCPLLPHVVILKSPDFKCMIPPGGWDPATSSCSDIKPGPVRLSRLNASEECAHLLFSLCLIKSTTATKMVSSSLLVGLVSVASFTHGLPLRSTDDLMHGSPNFLSTRDAQVGGIAFTHLFKTLTR